MNRPRTGDGMKQFAAFVMAIALIATACGSDAAEIDVGTAAQAEAEAPADQDAPAEEQAPAEEEAEVEPEGEPQPVDDGCPDEDFLLEVNDVERDDGYADPELAQVAAIRAFIGVDERDEGLAAQVAGPRPDATLLGRRHPRRPVNREIRIVVLVTKLVAQGIEWQKSHLGLRANTIPLDCRRGINLKVQRAASVRNNMILIGLLC